MVSRSGSVSRRAIWVVQFALLSAVLGVIASLVPNPWWPTDQDVYERIGRELLVPGCADLHCYRVVVPWVIESLPLPSALAWRVYAVLCEAGTGVAIGYLVTKFGADARTARQCAWITALGAGALYTLFDPHTADPLMHLIAPIAMMLAVDNRVVAAGALAGIGIFAKEFAVVPLVVVGIGRALQNRMPEATRLLSVACAVFGIWTVWHLTLRLALGYSMAASESASVLQGSYIAWWIINIGPGRALMSTVMVFGVLWLLWPVGLVWGPRELRQFTFGAIPVILVFCAVQQPDRALWNFVFLIMPAAAFVLARVPAALGWALVAAHGLANLRFGAQLTFVPPGRVSLAVAGGVALLCVWAAARTPRRVEITA